MPESSCGFADTSVATGKELLIEYGPTLLVNIGFDGNWAPVLPVTIPTPGIVDVEALVDTGATVSCIDDDLAKTLNLPIIDIRSMSGIHGELSVTIYLAQIHVPSLNKTIYGDFAGVHLIAGGQPHRALLGRTFLQAYKMLYDGRTGNVVITTAP
jgi:predicted aspartyl protease